MMSGFFIIMTLVAVFLATFVNQTRQAILALWVAGLGIGGLYLTLGAEFLAIIQWIISTLVTIGFIFFAVMFGEFNSAVKTQKLSRNEIITLSLAVVLGICFAMIVWLGAGNLDSQIVAAPDQVSDLSAFGHKLIEEHFLSIEVLALTLFLVLLGGGVIARSEGGPES
jgi:NADH:ubiquinone oxidoreductase subunit 6 (subunit J)